MYTGVVEETGTVAGRSRTKAGCRLRIETDTTGLSPGDSIAVHGVCLTAESVTDGAFTVCCSEETLARTYLETTAPGRTVHIERPIGADGRFDGHLVRGTVEQVTRLRAIDGERYRIAIPTGSERWLVEKGAVALDGVSLTVATIDDETFTVALVPETLERTTFGSASPGDRLHFEPDVLAKYAQQAPTGSRNTPK